MGMKDDLLRALAVSLVEGANVYGPVVAKMGLDDMVDALNTLLDGHVEEAQNKLRLHMTVEELSVEKVKLAALTKLLVAEELRIRAIGIKILNKLLEVAFGSLVGP